MSEKEEIPPPTPDGHHPGAGDQAVGPASKEPEIIWHDDDDDDDDDPPMAPHRKEGRGCFLTLLIVSAIPVIFFLITFTGGDFLTYIYMRNWVPIPPGSTPPEKPRAIDKEPAPAAGPNQPDHPDSE